MKLRCASCNFELNLSIKSLPKNARLFCPKCKGVLAPAEEVTESAPQTIPNPVSIPAPQEIISPQQNQSTPPVKVSPPVPLPIQNINSPQMLQENKTPSSQLQLFSEDIVPEFELNQSEEEVLKKREQLFSKPEEVWYDSTAKPPPVPAAQNISPPPIPLNIPPPIPSNTPPPIPPTSTSFQSGYISASSNIQIDSSLVMSEHQPDRPVSQPPLPSPPILEEKIELVKEPSPPLPSKESAIAREEVKAEKAEETSLNVGTSEKKDVILLTTPSYERKKISITIPAISLIVLALIAGFIYYQIVVSSSRTDFIKDLKSTPSLGTIPPINNSSSKNVEKKEDSQTKNEATGSKGSKIPIKAKKSALEHYKKGNQYFMEGKYEQARDEYAMATAADPTFALAYRGLGTTYAKLGQPDLAVKHYEKYIEVMPNASDAEQVKNIIKQYYGK